MKQEVLFHELIKWGDMSKMFPTRSLKEKYALCNSQNAC